jgi:hypothetical protein
MTNHEKVVPMTPQRRAPKATGFASTHGSLIRSTVWRPQSGWQVVTGAQSLSRA